MQRSWLYVLGLGLSVPRLCWANQGSQVVELGYLAPNTCPDQDAVWQKLSRHSSIEPATPGAARSAAVQLRVFVSRAGYSGQLTVVMSEQTLTRQVEDASCEALLDALTLVAAIAMDRTHRNEVASNQPHQPSAAAVPRSHAHLPLPTWSTGVAFGLHDNVAPVALPTVGVYATYRRRDFGLVGHYFGSLSIGHTSSLHFGLGEAKFTWLGGRFAACPIGSAVARFSFGVCGITEFGWLSGSGGGGAVAPRTTGGLWLSPGLGVTANVAISWLELAWLGGAVVPITRDRYYFAPDETVFRPRWLGLVAELRLGWTIW